MDAIDFALPGGWAEHTDIAFQFIKHMLKPGRTDAPDGRLQNHILVGLRDHCTVLEAEARMKELSFRFHPDKIDPMMDKFLDANAQMVRWEDVMMLICLVCVRLAQY
jgi:hypothetical protein